MSLPETDLDNRHAGNSSKLLFVKVKMSLLNDLEPSSIQRFCPLPLVRILLPFQPAVASFG
jgi:hypothetical protein